MPKKPNSFTQRQKGEILAKVLKKTKRYYEESVQAKEADEASATLERETRQS